MSEFVAVAAVGEIPPGSGKQIDLAGHAIAVFNVDGTFFAIDGTCLHRGGPVGEGDLEGTTVTCPWHGWQYDVTTGEHLLDRTIGLAAHEVRIENETILVALKR